MAVLHLSHDLGHVVARHATHPLPFLAIALATVVKACRRPLLKLVTAANVPVANHKS
jgi:hypothetical protein